MNIWRPLLITKLTAELRGSGVCPEEENLGAIELVLFLNDAQ